MKKMFPYAIVLSIVLIIVGVVLAELLEGIVDKKIVYLVIYILGIIICFDYIKTADRNDDVYLKIGAVVFPIITLIVIGFMGKSEELFDKEVLNDKLKKIKLKKGELKVLKHKGILEEADFNNKISELDLEDKSLKIEFQLKNNKKYASINDAFKKGYINKVQFEEKLAGIKVAIESNLK